MITPMERINQLKNQGLKSLYPEKLKIVVGRASCGRASGAEQVYHHFQDAVEKGELDAVVGSSGCLGYCQKEPLVSVQLPGGSRYIYAGVDVELAQEICVGLRTGHFSVRGMLGREVEDRCVVTGESVLFSWQRENEIGQKDVPLLTEIPFYSRQVKIATRNCGYVDPESIWEYAARGEYQALAKALKMSSREVIREVRSSGLRGRGGGGFPTGVKWEACYNSPGANKYVICNADEGDPGAYMDRSILEGDPHTILEGMIIGAYAMGANTGIIYCRAEYPLAVTTLEGAIRQAEEWGFLGENILGSGFNCHLKIVKGQGAFVCGEETALIASIEGKMGEPRPRPPFPAQSGLWGKPTNINNVETWANIPPIISRGAQWFSGFGTKNSTGTKVFALVGNIQNNGLVEVPMGTTISDIIYEIGGGCGEFSLKAVQTGGPSGGCIPRSMVHLQVDYEALKQVGAIMGSGGLVVMDERTCMVDVARYFLDFTQGESCGKCLPCREGTRQMLALLNKITSGQGELADLDLLEELSLSVKDASLCGLGQTAPNPVLSTMKYFRGEYEEHIVDRRCSASVCEKLVIASCQNECPAGIDVPIYVDLVKHRKFREAFDVIYRDNPFPATCGRVCPHPCELRCRRGLLDDAVGIRELKRFACDYVYEKEELKVSPPRRRKSQHIGIIGSGPAGLTVGFYLAKLGYAATIYEAQPVAGGMMAVGIPDYRLPKGILNREIALVEAMGVEIQTNIKIGKHISIGELRQKHDALFVGVGAQKELPLDIPGEKLKGVLSGLEFLHVINLSNKKVSLRGKTVVVIGGGHTAIDAARSALRLGAKAHIVYRREMKDMPAFKDKEEIFQAQNEGVEFTFLAVPVKFLGKGDWLTGVVCQRMCLGKFDQSGRRRPVPVEGEEFIISADFVIPSVGQEPEYDGFDREIGLKISKWNTLVVDSRTLGTNIPGVFAGGDCVTGPATVVEAIGAGKRAAASIDRYLGGSGKLHDEETILREVFGPVAEPGQKMKAGLISLGQRARNFNEVECVYTEYQAITEAARCMRCDCKESEDEDAQGVKCPGCSS